VKFATKATIALRPLSRQAVIRQRLDRSHFRGDAGSMRFARSSLTGAFANGLNGKTWREFL
jgi:hypothetical protein